MAEPASNLRRALDWGSLAPLRLRARAVAEGAYAGVHRSTRRGAGVEFGGHREYTPGDDLRWLDRRSLLLHNRLLVRQFEMETDRVVRLVVDTTASMGYRGSRAPGAKLAYASLLSAALARVALMGGDPVGLTFLGDLGPPLPQSSGREQFERIVGILETTEAGGDARLDPTVVSRSLERLPRALRRGAVLVVFSDLLDLPPGTMEALAALAARGRVLVVCQVLDPDEVTFPFEGTVRLRALEGDVVVETDGAVAREAYLEALEGLVATWQGALVPREGRFLRAVTSDDPVTVVRRILEAIR